VRRLLRSRESFLVSPDELSRLAVGEAAVSVRFGQQRLAVVQIQVPPLSRAVAPATGAAS
jgi:hypothetical protein